MEAVFYEIGLVAGMALGYALGFWRASEDCKRRMKEMLRFVGEVNQQ